MIGVCSAGLASTGLPAASAAAIWPVKMASGKFHGAMAANGPRARSSMVLVSPVGPFERLRLAEQAAGFDRIVAQEIDGLAHVAQRVGQRLAGFAHDARPSAARGRARTDRRRVRESWRAPAPPMRSQPCAAFAAVLTAASTCAGVATRTVPSRWRRSCGQVTSVAAVPPDGHVTADDGAGLERGLRAPLPSRRRDARGPACRSAPGRSSSCARAR